MAQIRAAGGVPVYLGERIYELEKEFPPDCDRGHYSPELAKKMNARAIEMAEQDVKQLDGIVIAGSTYDIDPVLYGEKPDPRLYGNKPYYNKDNPNARLSLMGQARQQYELALIRRAFDPKDSIPLLGICAGMELMNVSANDEQNPRAGTLIQDIELAMEKIGYKSRLTYHGSAGFEKREFVFTPVQFIGFRPGSLLAKLAKGVKGIYSPSLTKDLAPDLPGGIIAENSFHHQAIGKVRPGFIATSFNEDGVINSIEPDPNGPYAGKPFLGVQWHPEFAASDFSAKLFRNFIDRAREIDRTPGLSILQYKDRILPQSLKDQIARRKDAVSAIERYLRTDNPDTPLFSR